MKIANHNIKSDGVYIIAEISANHNGSLKNALNSIKAAKEIGANAVKIQTYTADTITLNCDKDDFIIKGGTLWDNKTLYELYSEAYTPWEWHKELFEYAKKTNIDLFSTPFDKTSVDFLEQFNPPAYKIASFEITDYDLIRYVAQKQKPIIISTGIATIDEIQDVVDICREENNHDIILLKCTSEYPAPLEEANLCMIKNLAETFGVYSGFSDHTLGDTAPIIATCFGAKVIEKHFILDKSIGGPDSAFSLDYNEFKQMIENVRKTEKMIGKINYSLNEKKQKSRRFARSLYISKDIKKGETFTCDNIKSIRPGYGSHPKNLNKFIGKTADKDYTLGDRLI